MPVSPCSCTAVSGPNPRANMPAACWTSRPAARGSAPDWRRASRPGVILVVPSIGRIEGRVVRREGGEFSVSFNAPQRKRDKLADAITWRFNKDRLGLEEDRTAPRKPGRGRARILLDDGVVIQADVIDVSVTGAAFECLERPRIGEPLRVGEMSGRVARILDNGFAVVFDPPRAKAGGPEAA